MRVCLPHRHFIHRLRLLACAAVKICTVVILGLPKGSIRAVQVGSAVGKPIYT